MELKDDDLWDMSDEDLEAAFKEAVKQDPDPEGAGIEGVDADELPVDETTDEELDDVDDSDEEIDVDDTENKDDKSGDEDPEEDLEDSDHDTSDKSEDEKVEDDNTEDSDKVDPDGDTESDDKESPDDTDETKDEKQPAQSHSFKANGKDYEFTSEEIVEQFPKMFGKAMDYTKKMQTIKPWRKTIDALEGAELKHDDVSLMIDVLKGDKEAINEVLKRTGVDTLELNAEDASAYEAKDYGRDDAALDVSDVIKDIQGDTEYTTTHNILSNEWDERSWETISENPEMIKLLHTDVKSGMYDTLQPIAEKLKVFGGASKSDLDYYKDAAQQYYQKTNSQKPAQQQQRPVIEKQEPVVEDKVDRIAEARSKSEKRTKTKTASAKRKAAAPAKSTKADRVVDYLEESDENFDDWYNKLKNDM